MSSKKKSRSYMDQEALERCLWASNDGYELWIEEEARKASQFYVVNGTNGKVLLQWQHEFKTTANVCCVCTTEDGQNGEQTHLLKVAWSDSRTVYCDYVTISGNLPVLVTEPLIDVSFDITAFELIWNQGVALIVEEALGCLHVFDTGLNRYLGYVTLFSNAKTNLQLAQLIKYASAQSTLWAIVRQYDESTKVSWACLNTYQISNFTLKSTVQLPRGFTDYTFVNVPGIKHLQRFEEMSTVVCSSCDILGKSVIQWFLSPKMPWREVQRDHSHH